MNDPDVVRDETIHRNVKTVYNYLVTFCGADRTGYPGRSRMSRETGLSLSALDVAKKAGQDIGLWTIEQRPLRPDDPDCKQLTSNRYWLHDFGDGYIPGTGGARREKGKPRGRHAAADPSQILAGDPSQILGEPLPDFGQEEDKGAGPLSSSNTSSTTNAPCAGQPQAADPDQKIHAACAGSAQAPPARDTSNLFLPKGFDTLPLKAARGYLIRATVAALQARGHALTDNAKSELGQTLRSYGRHHRARHDMADMIRDGLNDPARFAAALEAGQPFTPPPLPDLDVTAFDIEDQIGDYIKSVLGAPIGEATRSVILGRIGHGDPVQAIVNDALCIERGIKTVWGAA